MINGGRIHPYARHHKHHMQGGDIFTPENVRLGLKYGPAAASAAFAVPGIVNYAYRAFTDDGRERPAADYVAKRAGEFFDSVGKSSGLEGAKLSADLFRKSNATTGEPIQKKDFALPTLSFIAPPPLIGRSGPGFTPRTLWDKRPGRARFQRSLKPLHSSSASKRSPISKKPSSKKKKPARKKVHRKGGALINNTGADSHPDAHGYNWTSVQN